MEPPSNWTSPIQPARLTNGLASVRHQAVGGPANLGLHRFAVFTALSTAFLIFAGGLVTSTDSGLAVPDWPLSYGQLFPRMVGGILYEHGHRMVAMFVGLLTVILAIWAWRREPRRWVRTLAFAALGAVIAQGTLGGITVLFFLPTPVSVAHAMLAQTFFCLVVSLALFTSPTWKRGMPVAGVRNRRLNLPVVAALTTGAVYIQLLLGALMRHTDSGLAIPDFPLAFGRIVPPFESPQVTIHFAHRIGALFVTSMAIWTLARVASTYKQHRQLFRPAAVLAVLVALQIGLGAFTVWTGVALNQELSYYEQPLMNHVVIITTLHVVTGATILAVSLLLTLRSFAMVAPPATRVQTAV
jgi:cytochrome c oxidase assembly protein subunit 15